MTIKPLPPADYTPASGNYNTLQPFRYWCQKVLPLVYDDSLSYYELLCKVVDYLNKTMEDVETLHGDVTNLHEAYEKLQTYVNDYFSTLDVQEEINKKLDEMVTTGELYTLLFQFYSPMTIYGHRGYTRGSSLLSIDNSPWAIYYAKNVGCDGVEIDVRIDVNGEYVCLHDDDVSSISNQSGSISTWNYTNVIYANKWKIDTGVHLISVKQCVNICKMLKLNVLFDMGKLGGEHIKNIANICDAIGFKNYGFYDLEDYDEETDYSVYANLNDYVKKYCDLRNDNYTLNDIKEIISKIGTTINVGFRLYNANISFTDEAMNYIKNNHISLGAINVNQTTKFDTSWAIFDGPMVVPDDAITHYSATVYRGINGNTGKGDPYNPQKSIYELAVMENFGGSTQRLTCGQCLSANKDVVFPDEPGTQGVIYLVCGSDGKGNFMLIQNRKPKSPLKVLHSEFTGNVSNKLTLESNFSFNSDNFDNTYTTLIEYINKACELMSNNLEGIHLRCTIYIRGNAASKLTDIPLEYKNNGLCVICELISYENGLPFGTYTCIARRSDNVKTGWFENNILY